MSSPEVPMVEAEPHPFTWRFSRARGHSVALPGGESIPLVVMELHHAAGVTVLYLPASDVPAFTNDARTAANMPIVASSLGGTP